jgi:teichoic acid transport system permease protein
MLLDGPYYAVKPEYWLYSGLWAFGTLVIGVLFFWAAEERYGRTD